jgi:lipoyl-dependent peroxiredoxin
MLQRPATAGASIDKIDNRHRNIWASALSLEGLTWRIMNVVYSTTVSSVGGRDGTIRSDDGMLDLKVAMPHSLGGAGGATNPEQLFAAGYAACFADAVMQATRNNGHEVLEQDIEVVAEVDLEASFDGSFGLALSVIVMIAGVGQKIAEQIVHAANAICPYSNAVRGNINVAISVVTR